MFYKIAITKIKKILSYKRSRFFTRNILKFFVHMFIVLSYAYNLSSRYLYFLIKTYAKLIYIILYLLYLLIKNLIISNVTHTHNNCKCTLNCYLLLKL